MTYTLTTRYGEIIITKENYGATIECNKGSSSFEVDEIKQIIELLKLSIKE